MDHQVLIPLDGSPLSERAISHAILLARGLDAPITLLSVVEPDQNRDEHWFSDYLKIKVQEIETGGDQAEYQVKIGNVADEILNMAEEEKASLVVMSTHGRSGVSRWQLGSITHKVVLESYVPLLLIKTGAISETTDIERHREILVAVDGSVSSEAIIPCACRFAHALQKDVILFCVNESTELGRHVRPELIAQWGTGYQKAIRRTQTGIQDYLDTLKSELESQQINVCTRTVLGDAAGEIINYAEANDVCLIAITTQGYSGFSQHSLGSVASEVVHGTSKPLLIVRPHPKILNPDSAKCRVGRERGG